MNARDLLSIVAMLVLAAAAPASAQDEDSDDSESKTKEGSPEVFASLKLRSIGPALMSGRIGDFAVDPNDYSHYFVAVCSGGVWKTTNAGATFTPVFDRQGAYSIGCVTMDPNNSNVVWVGAGENNSQRSVSFGDGVYLSRDGGKNWKNMGLKESEHIGMITIDPRDSNVVYVAAQGPLWRSGGERGLYKTTNGGKSWTRILHISDDTGINEVHMDPRDPDLLYVSSYQRRRRVWTLINGGPESAIYKSTDAGKTWRKLTRGVPGGDKGRIGLDISPADPDVIYAIIEAADGKGGFFRSSDRGESWSKRSSYMTSSPQYYNEIVCDPIEVDRVYSLNTLLQVTEDGGRTFTPAPRKSRHVDDHALWINPDNNKHLLVGCDGGIYDSYDRGQNWNYKPNLPITQFYRVSVDNSTPFYYVYGGTQDNNTLGGPSRTTNRTGIVNADWFVTVGGDGFETQVDPEDPNIVYSQWQYGGLVRHDRRSGEVVDIKPREAPGETPIRWNWDSPLIISPHDHKRLYFGGNILFRSDDQGDSWTAVSGDLSSGVDRDTLKIMGKIQKIDAVSKNRSTSIYGNTIALSESPMVEGLIYVGTDDGLIHVTEDGGKNWRKIAVFPTVPDITYVSCLTASMNDADTIYASFDNHKNGDFKPYILKSSDRGKTWKSIVGDLPLRDVVYSVAEDHVNADLLFAGTEFGVYFTVDGGKKWIKFKSGIPTIAVKDIAIQRRENDLVLGTFGRSFYILDDYTPLRHASKEDLSKNTIFPIKDALRYIQRSGPGGSQGASFYSAPNPAFGAVFTYYLKDKLQTRKERRKEAEKKDASKYPTVDDMRDEDAEQPPAIILIVRDESGDVVRRVSGSRSKGLHRVTWDLRYPSTNPPRIGSGASSGSRRRRGGGAGPLVLPGTYTVELAKVVEGKTETLVEPVSFNVIPLELATFAAKDREAVFAFQKKVARLQRAVTGASRVAGEAQTRIQYIKAAIRETLAADPALLHEAFELENTLRKLTTKLNGDSTLRRLQSPVPQSISQRISGVVGSQWNVTSPPTQTQRNQYLHAGTEFTEVLAALRALIEKDLIGLEQKLEAAGAPWTPGRIPKWKMEDD